MVSKSVARRLDQLAAQYGLDGKARYRLEALLQALSEEHAPTSVRDEKVGVDIHIADSLVALDLEQVKNGAVIADIGAGAGLPSLVLAIALPESQIFAIESIRKKCEFIAETAQSLGLSNIDVVCSRVELWSEGRELCDVVCARAVAPLTNLCEYAAPLLRQGGSLVAWKGSISAEEADDSAIAADELGLVERETIPVVPYEGSRDRVLCLYQKVSPTPDRFPRRPGMAIKRPLKASK